MWVPRLASSRGPAAMHEMKASTAPRATQPQMRKVRGRARIGGRRAERAKSRAPSQGDSEESGTNGHDGAPPPDGRARSVLSCRGGSSCADLRSGCARSGYVRSEWFPPAAADLGSALESADPIEPSRTLHPSVHDTVPLAVLIAMRG